MMAKGLLFLPFLQIVMIYALNWLVGKRKGGNCGFGDGAMINRLEERENVFSHLLLFTQSIPMEFANTRHAGARRGGLKHAFPFITKLHPIIKESMSS